MTEGSDSDKAEGSDSRSVGYGGVRVSLQADDRAERSDENRGIFPDSDPIWVDLMVVLMYAFSTLVAIMLVRTGEVFMMALGFLMLLFIAFIGVVNWVVMTLDV